ncbi:MAG: V-type ATP synthase subunit D [Planctomycetota bacterium]|jgi:V/A-type H+-transporting ATPase subunit D
MAEKLKLTKDSLNKEKKNLQRYTRFLPTLKLRKSQLFNEIHEIRMKMEAKEAEIESTRTDVAQWVAVFGEEVEIERYFKVNEVVLEPGNVAGIDIPVLKTIDFEENDVDLMATPFWIDAGLRALKAAVLLKIELKILNEQKEIITEELNTTVQRINLFEKVKIPQTQENIKKIRIFLGDQQTASVVCGKISKGKLNKKRKAKRLALSM